MFGCFCFWLQHFIDAQLHSHHFDQLPFDVGETLVSAEDRLQFLLTPLKLCWLLSRIMIIWDAFCLNMGSLCKVSSNAFGSSTCKGEQIWGIWHPLAKLDLHDQGEEDSCNYGEEGGIRHIRDWAHPGNPFWSPQLIFSDNTSKFLCLVLNTSAKSWISNLLHQVDVRCGYSGKDA